MRILLAGSFASTPQQGGAAWAVLQYALGLEQLGHEVALVDRSPVEPHFWHSFRSTLDRAGFLGDSALWHVGRCTSGMSWQALTEWADRADLLLNLGGALRCDELIEMVRHRVYVDLDPAFTQLWHDVEGVDMGLDAHHSFVTVGQNIGTPASAIPTCARSWIPTFPPVVMDRWTFADSEPCYGLTTVANWRSYGSIRLDDVLYGQKAHSFRELFALPSALAAFRVSLPVEPALCIHGDEFADLIEFDRHAWDVRDALALTSSIEHYQRFVRTSTMEIGIAKSGYVRSNSGWFSDRSVAYLASGRPVVAQDTGWSVHLPNGKGLLAFSDTLGAAEAVSQVCDSYDLHRREARALAEDHFDSRIVLPRMLEAVCR